MFNQLEKKIICVASTMDFLKATKSLAEYIDSVDGFIDILEQIGTIPESIDHDSSAEKLFAKASDAVLSRAFREIGLKSTIISERADSADVQAESKIHKYSLVADAKAFRMSRTAKNQKDFKVAALSGWRKDANYAVLCSPFFQYPKSKSQIYAQSIEHNVCLLSWEDMLFMIKNKIKESETLNLSTLWNFGKKLSKTVVVDDNKNCFLGEYRKFFLSVLKCSAADYDKLIREQVDNIKRRGVLEKKYWEDEKTAILSYTKEKAIHELVKSRKIDEKIQQIEQYIRGVSRG